MAERGRAFAASARLEFTQLARSRLLVVFTFLQAITFVVLVSLFGLTGSRAPTGVINEDHGRLASSFITYLLRAHHSFSLRTVSVRQAKDDLASGRLVAVITIPAGFTAAVSSGRTAVVPVQVDNVDIDLTDDIQRAVPSAVAAFGRANGFPGIRAVVAEQDLISHDTGFVPYLVVSALALDALVVAGVLGAVAITREIEAGTLTEWQLAPVDPPYLLAGKLVASSTVSAVAVGLATAVVFVGYGIHPTNIPATLGALLLCVAIFTCVGACIGALLKRSLPVTALLFGLALPLYIDSGALEPERFDGSLIWSIAHASPVYFAVGVLEDAVHGLHVTPEPPVADALILVLWATAAILITSVLLSRRVATA